MLVTFIPQTNYLPQCIIISLQVCKKRLNKVIGWVHVAQILLERLMFWKLNFFHYPSVFYFSEISCLHDRNVTLHMKTMLLDIVCTLVMKATVASRIGHLWFLKRKNCDFVKHSLQIQVKKTAHFWILIRNNSLKANGQGCVRSHASPIIVQGFSCSFLWL